MPARLRAATLHRLKAELVTEKEFVRAALTGRLRQTVPQGGIPSGLLASTWIRALCSHTEPCAVAPGKSRHRARIGTLTRRYRARFCALLVSWPTEYSRANLNGRLIDRGELLANVEHVAFAASRVKQFD